MSGSSRVQSIIFTISRQRSDEFAFLDGDVLPTLSEPSKNGLERHLKEDPMALNRTFDLIMVSAAFLFVSAMCVGLL